MAAYAILLCGPPGSGKSTYYRRFLSSLKLLSTDALVMEYAKFTGSTYEKEFKDYFPIADQEYMKRLDEYQSQGVSFVIDRTNLTLKSRARTLKLIKPSYRKVAIAFPHVPVDVLIERIKDRTDQPLAPGLIKSMAEVYVKPTEAEGFDNIIDLDENIDPR